jgi:hypothetical protein
MFRLHRAISLSFPGPLGIHKNLPAVELNDQRTHNIIDQFPPELSITDDYNPSPDESPLELIKRYTLVCLAYGHLITLHRPYTSKSDYSKRAITMAAWKIASLHPQLLELLPRLEQYLWFIEEFIDAHIFRATLVLGAQLAREPGNPLAPSIMEHVNLCVRQSKVKALRKRDYAKAYGAFEKLKSALEAPAESPQPNVGPSAPEGSPSVSRDGGADWGVGANVLEESMFRWDDYLVDMLLDQDQ